MRIRRAYRAATAVSRAATAVSRAATSLFRAATVRERFPLLACFAIAGTLLSAELSPVEYLDYIKYLASEKLKGRATGSPELEKAAAYIAKQFKAMHLKPLEGDSYYQNFEVTTSAKLGARGSFNEEFEHRSLTLQRDYVPLNLSSSGAVDGQLVFAGYGITAPEYNYDDYSGIDAKDKIVVVLRHEPQELDDKSIFEGKVYTAHSQIFAKAVNAKMHGAKAIVFVNDLHAHPNDKDELDKFGTTEGPANAGIAVIQVTAAIASPWFTSHGATLNELAKAIDSDLKTRSFEFPKEMRCRLYVDIEREVKTVHNVGAYLAGETAEYVILGAHYDHLGLGGQFFLAPSMTGTVHPGADDNASGTAGVVQLAHWFSQQPKHKSGLLFPTSPAPTPALLAPNSTPPPPPF